MSIVLGLWTGVDAGACLVVDGEPTVAVNEERLTRVKHFSGFPEQSVRYVLEGSGVEPSQVEYVSISSRDANLYLRRMWSQNSFSAFFDTLRTRFTQSQKLAGHYYPAGTYKSSPTPTTGMNEGLAAIGIDAPIVNYDHHVAHVRYGHFLSGYEKAIVVSLDGEGGGLSGMVAHIDGDKMDIVQEIGIHGQSIGLFFGCVTEAIGFKVNDGEGKTMGLAAFGEPSETLIAELSVLAPKVEGKRLVSGRVWDYVVALDEDGSPRTFFRDSYLIRGLVHKYGKENVAAAAQKILEDVVGEWLANLVGERPYSENLIIVGGVGLNISNNFALWEERLFKRIFIPPAPGDNGLAMALALLHADTLGERKKGAMRRPYFGRSYNREMILEQFQEYSDRLELREVEDLPGEVALLLSEGRIIGWYQGACEWGNRALGARSVIADPRAADTKERINHHLKERDWFMPFAPSMLGDHAEEIFESSCESLFMNHKFVVREEWREKIPAVMHVDDSARPHMVYRDANPLYYEMIDRFRELTGVPLVLNTSFNKHGLPIVETPHDAYDHLIWNCVEALAIGPFIVTLRE